MLKEIRLNDRILKYDLQYKNVKNINLRIKPDGTVNVSANKRVPQGAVDNFIISKADFIFKALDRCANIRNSPPRQYFAEEEICGVITRLCEKIYPHFEKSGIKYPEIKFKRMVSQWGNCRAQKGILTFNINLMYAPCECIEYVVAHEFTHFLVLNHSNAFYAELSKVMPDWKMRQQKLKEIFLR